MILVSAQEAYERWADSYDSDLNPVTALESRVISPVLDRMRPLRIADVGCGTGRWLKRLTRPDRKVVGFDLSLPMLRQARHHVALKHRLAVARAEYLPIQTGWADLLLCSLSLGYIPEIKSTFREFSRVVRANGLVMINDLHPEALTSGWTRSFRTNGLSYRIESWHHSLSAIRDSAEESGLALESLEEPSFGAEEFPIFHAAGKATAFESLRIRPAIFVAIWRRKC